MTIRVAGVDGCRGRWAVVTWNRGQDHDRGPGHLTGELVDDLADLVAATRRGEMAAVAVDMPIGLFDSGPRPCDRAARRFLGPRRSTVFPAPARVTLTAADYDEACRLSRARTGRALSRQTFNLLGPIRALDRLLSPSDGDRIVEAHPECAFARLAGEPLPPKRTAEGRRRRRQLVEQVLGTEPVGRLVDEAPVPMIDLLDATVLAVTAARVVDGSAIRLGGEVDPTGKRAQIVY